MPSVLGSSGCMSLEKADDPDFGVQFHVSDEFATAETGDGVCQSAVGGVVTSIDDFKQHDMIAKLLDEIGVDEAYIGLFDASVGNGAQLDTSRFQWVDGSNFSFGSVGGEFPWFQDFPKNEGFFNEANAEFDEADCTKIFLVDQDYFWKDVDCRSEFPVICRTYCSVSAFESDSYGSALDPIILAGAGVVGFLALVALIVGLVLRSNRMTHEKNEQILNNMEPIDQTKHLNEQMYGNANRPSGLGLSLRSALSKLSFRSSQSSLNPPLVESNPLAKRLKEMDRNNKKQVMEAGAAPKDFVEESPEDML